MSRSLDLQNRLQGRALSGRFELAGLLGSGGFADVYRAYDRLTHQTVAIKILYEHMARDPEVVKRFEREARVASQIVEPHVVRILDTGEDANTHYIVMEFVEGSTLFKILADGKVFTPADIVDIGCQSLSGLAAAHRIGVVHRDIKPANLILTAEGLLKMMDFGIAKVSTGATQTRTGLFMGTPEYMAPEQVDNPSNVDARTDLYSLGVTLYELLVGVPPFRAETPWATLAQHMMKAPPPPRDVRPDTPITLQAVLLRALEKLPENRYRNADEMRHALETCLQGGGPKPPPSLLTLASSMAGPTAPTAPAMPPAPGTPPPDLMPTAAAVPPVAGEYPTVGAGAANGATHAVDALTSAGAPMTAAAPVSAPIPTPSPTPSPAIRRPIPAPVPVPASPAKRGAPIVLILAAVVLGALVILGGLYLGTGTTLLGTGPAATAVPTAVASGPGAATSQAGAGGSALIAPTTAPLTPPTNVPPTAAPQVTNTAVPPTLGPADRLAGAKRLLDSGQVEQAIPQLEALYLQDPAMPDLAPTLGKAYVTRGQDALARDDLDTSATAFDKALVVRSNDEAAQAGRKRVMARRAWLQMEAAWGKDDDAAISALEQVRANDPEYRSADVKDKLYVVRLGRADNLVKAGNGDAAAEELKRAVEIDPERPEAKQRLQALTPTPTPVPPTATPVPYVAPPAAPASKPQAPAAAPAAAPASKPQAPAAQPAQPAQQPAQPVQPPAAPKTNRPPPGSESPL